MALNTNILIDLLADRKPFSNWAYKIFNDQKKGKWTLYASSISIVTAYYIIEKQTGNRKAKEAIQLLLDRLEIKGAEKKALLRGIKADFKDFEDAVQHECALKIKNLDYIISRNKKDFKESMIPVISSAELYL